MHRRHLGSLLLLVAMGAMGACAEQQPAINRVEAYALPKSLFSGEWLYGQTVVDVPGTNTVTMVGNTNYMGMYRIRWDVQENYLYARKADEKVEGAKVGQDPQTGEYKGAIVGAWRITSHFDVKRAYNPTTGEELNVIEENGSDCKWYDCKYMRVDWSANEAIDYAFLDSEEYFKKESMPFFEQDAHDPRWRPVFDARNGYIDVTSSVVIKPMSFYFARWNFNYPLCWAYENMECTPEVTKIRNSFFRRDPNRDFEPREHTGPYDEMFGYFVQERLTWENHYGITYRAKKKLINRHNLWVKHHKDEDGAACLVSMPKETACTSDKDCQTKLTDPKASCNTGTKKCVGSGDKYCTDTFGAGSRCDNLIRFHRYDVATDTDVDGLPDSFEAEAGLDPETADSNKNNVTDASEDKVGFTTANGLQEGPNGVRDIEDFWAWDSANMEHRCTIPMAERDPVPIPYYNTGFFPRSLVCDEDRTDPTKDKNKGPCEAWSFIKPADRAKMASTLHKISLDYDETYWKTFLRGVWGWNVDDYNKWITTHDINAMGADKQEILRKFGDEEQGFYAFSICPNNPVQEYDPWPCRFPHMSFAQAKALIDEGRKFGTVDENGKEVAPFIRHGDIRYSMVNYVKDYYDGWALLGLGPSMTDPVTGENLAGVANVYGLNDWAATNIQEQVQLLNGQISPTDFINGVNLTNFIKRMNQDQASEANQNGLGLNQPVPPASIQSMYQATRQSWLNKIPKAGDRRAIFPVLEKDDVGQPLSNRQLKKKLLARAHERGLFSKGGSPRDLSIIAGTPLEKYLVDDEILMAAGYAPGTIKEVSNDVLAKASVARDTSFIRNAQAEKALRMELSHKRQMDFLEMTDDAVDGLAARLKNLPPEKLWATLRDIIMRAVLTHEMGHTVGLHHNWAGSEDALNFHDQYWQLRSDNFTMKDQCKADGSNKGTAICPFSVKPMSNYMKYGDPGKGLNSLYEYAYSSIMDYAGKYHLDGNGLSKYDRAAVMYGHVDKVEVFQNLGNVTKPAGNNNVFEEWFESSANPFWLPPPDYTLTAYHYTNWYAQMGNLAFDEKNRKIVDYRELKDIEETSLQGTRRKGWFYVDPKTNAELPRVPYAFCTYTRGDISENCNTRDVGSDHYERMKTDVDNWETWYILRAFPRSEFGAGKYDYINRSFRRYDRLKNYNDSYALNMGFFNEWWDPTELQVFATDTVNGWGNFTIAVHDAYNMAVRTLAMPDIKLFELMNKPDGQRIWAEAEYISTNFRSDINNSRYFASNWRDTAGKDTCGLMWWECLHHNGFYLDKVVSLFVLADPFTNYAGVDTSEDIREWRVGFFENYSKQLIDFFGGLLAEDYEKIAPWVDLSKPADTTVVEGTTVWKNQMAWRDYASNDPVPGPGKPGGTKAGAVEAATRFTFQVYAALIGILAFQDNFDNEFVERARMWKEGKDTTWTITPTGNVNGPTKFTDPFNGSTYVGIDYKDGRGIAQRMIKHANDLKSRIPKFCGTACVPPPTGNNCDQACMALRAESALYKYRQLMDIVVQVMTIYSMQGGSWSWDPWDP